MKFGLEVEFFLLDKLGTPMLVPSGVPKDDCGWLVEARGEPANSIYKAVGSVVAETAQIKALLAKDFNDVLLDLKTPWRKLDQALLKAARRANSKGPVKYQNLYGHKDPAIGNVQTAGTHISFTNPRTYFDDSKQTQEYYAFWDYRPLFEALDHRFLNEIRAARRRPGFYEVKSDGRIEYRSLPNMIDLWEVAEFIENWSLEKADDEYDEYDE